MPLVTLNSLATRPQGSEAHYHFTTDVETELLKHVHDHLKASFTRYAQGDSFWENVQLQFRCSFTSTLISYRLEPKEKDTIDGLVLPMMRTLLLFLPNTEHLGFRAHLLTVKAFQKLLKDQAETQKWI